MNRPFDSGLARDFLASNQNFNGDQNMLFLLAIGCVALHHGDDGKVTYNVASDPYGARLMMDGETAQSAVEKGTNGKSVVTVSTNVEANPFHRESNTHVTIAPAYGGVTYATGTDPQLAQATALAAAYRQGYAQTHGFVQGSKAPPTFVSGSPGSAPAASGTGAIDMTAKCPSVGDHPRAPATQAERDACQDMIDRKLIVAAGVK